MDDRLPGPPDEDLVSQIRISLVVLPALTYGESATPSLSRSGAYSTWMSLVSGSETNCIVEMSASVVGRSTISTCGARISLGTTVAHEDNDELLFIRSTEEIL